MSLAESLTSGFRSMFSKYIIDYIDYFTTSTNFSCLSVRMAQRGTSNAHQPTPKEEVARHREGAQGQFDPQIGPVRASTHQTRKKTSLRSTQTNKVYLYLS